MTVDSVIALANKTMFTGFWIVAPILGISLGIGLIVAIFQAATQIQEASLAFLPKLIGIGLAVAMFGTWILEQLMNFATTMLSGGGMGLR